MDWRTECNSPEKKHWWPIIVGKQHIGTNTLTLLSSRKQTI